MEEAGEPSFDCSEMYVFGKFETFKKRLEEVKSFSLNQQIVTACFFVRLLTF